MGGKNIGYRPSLEGPYRSRGASCCSSGDEIRRRLTIIRREKDLVTFPVSGSQSSENVPSKYLHSRSKTDIGHREKAKDKNPFLSY